jgi:hypothetical protein
MSRNNLPSWSSRATLKGTRLESCCLSHNIRVPFAAPSPFEMASYWTPSLKEDNMASPLFHAAGIRIGQLMEVVTVACMAHIQRGGTILGSPSPSPNILSILPTHHATLSATLTSISFVCKLMYILV